MGHCGLDLGEFRIRHLTIAIAVEDRKGRGIRRPAHWRTGGRPISLLLRFATVELLLADAAVAVAVIGGKGQGRADRPGLGLCESGLRTGWLAAVTISVAPGRWRIVLPRSVRLPRSACSDANSVQGLILLRHI